MAKRIVIKARCYCCDYVEEPISILKPSRLVPGGFENVCENCGSYNSYRVSIKSDQVKIETTFIRASQKGIESYESRTGKKYPVFE